MSGSYSESPPTNSGILGIYKDPLKITTTSRGHHLEGQGDLVSGLITPKIRFISIINLLPEPP